MKHFTMNTIVIFECLWLVYARWTHTGIAYLQMKSSLFLSNSRMFHSDLNFFLVLKNEHNGDLWIKHPLSNNPKKHSSSMLMTLGKFIFFLNGSVFSLEFKWITLLNGSVWIYTSCCLLKLFSPSVLYFVVVVVVV